MKKSKLEENSTITQVTETGQKSEQETINMSDEQILAMNAYNPIVRAIATGQEFTKDITDTEVDIFASISILAKQIEDIKAGNLSCAEATLAAQADTLDLIFNSLMRKAANSKMINHFEMYMRLALKAQGQCRRTYETLAEIKNPRSMAFIKQQNIGLNQQVNNNAVPYVHEKSIKSSNELLEAQNGERLDTRAAGSTIGTDQELETVGIIDWGQNARRQNTL
ncbi:hypothetical protein [Nitrosomonas communis]|uniref:Uncharacterized protein n=1 Tax=Nitrosomonas communis TaxID=44574 RepID=A0A1I4S4H3_9PROT|nr:hypothetical protein [Nitrosomonas communis]SFM59170.1 hypothetical protein SAMN05421863_103729 [Nitrosomonas communis]